MSLASSVISWCTQNHVFGILKDKEITGGKHCWKDLDHENYNASLKKIKKTQMPIDRKMGK